MGLSPFLAVLLLPHPSLTTALASFISSLPPSNILAPSQPPPPLLCLPQTTLVNFTVTPAGLEDQLLALVVRKERPDLARKKAALVQQQNRFTIQIRQLEDDILQKLASAEGDVTENRDLIGDR